MDAGADANAPVGLQCGITALQGAAIRGHINIALVVLKAGADVNAVPAQKHGRSALEGVAEHGRLDMVQLLLNAGADTETTGETRFETAIYLAEKERHYAVANYIRNYSG